MPDGALHVWLVKPLDDWVHWQPSAEQVHGIPREELLREGITPRQVADELNELLAGKTVYSDGWGVDRTWLALLFHEAHVLQGFKLDSIYGLLSESEWEHWSEQRDEVLRLTGMVPHRAGTDALVIQKTFIHVKEPAAQLPDDDQVITHRAR
tara:strand:- start:10488 stop:10943 length:456 start_codon:yes stop_codon:yes gene_type:complete